MEPVVAAVVVALLAPLAIWFHQRELRRRHAMLAEVAAKYGGFALPSRLLSSPSLQVRLSGVDIRTRLWSTRAGHFTGWSCRVAPPGTAVFSLRAERALSPLRKIVGAPDVPLGNSVAFDRNYLVRTDDAAMLARLFGGQLGDRMLDWFPDGCLDSDGHELELVIGRLPSTPSDVERGIELLASIATRDLFGIAALRALADARYHAGSIGDLPHVVVDGPGNIRIGPERHGGRAITRARSQGAADLGLTAISVIDGQPGPGIDVDRLPAGALETLHALGTADVGWSDGEVSVTWRGIETDRRRLAAGVALLRELGRPSLGVFR